MSSRASQTEPFLPSSEVSLTCGSNVHALIVFSSKPAAMRARPYASSRHWIKCPCLD